MQVEGALTTILWRKLREIVLEEIEGDMATSEDMMGMSERIAAYQLVDYGVIGLQAVESRQAVERRVLGVGTVPNWILEYDACLRKASKQRIDDSAQVVAVGRRADR